MVRANNWPGQAYGMTAEQAQIFNGAQLISRTFYYNTSAGSMVKTDIELTGNATFLLGVRCDLADATDDGYDFRFTLFINNQWAFQDVPQSNLNYRQAGGDGLYYPVPRYVSSSKGAVVLQTEAVAQVELGVTFFWLSK